ncbi:ubiquitin domain-containing protein [Xylariaceae sp. FL1019]|nr:ubiquitin domain-containing protein [Xylariaceae sp. FL1019]
MPLHADSQGPGCCFSRPEGSSAPYPGDASSSPSVRAINPQPRQSSIADEAPGRSSLAQSHRFRQHQPLSQHIDKPLRFHRWIATDRAWTRNHLDQQRIEFFDTRVTGRPEVWQVIRGALEVLWGADSSESSSDETISNSADALATAQSILTAAEVTLPTGDLANGVYDSLGNYYSLPEWIVSDPTNIAEDSRAQSKSTKKNDKAEDDLTGEDTAEEPDQDEARQRREEKGKEVVNVKNLVKVRARLSENYPDVTIRIDADATVRSLAKKIADESFLPPSKRIRVAYMGKIIKENSTLESQGWQKDHIVNAFVFDR